MPLEIDSPLSHDSVLSLRDFGLRFHERTILRSVTVEVPARGCTVLLGPSGTGKSSLLRTMAGFNDLNPGMERWGEVRYRGLPLGPGNQPSMVMQKAQLMVANVLDNLQAGLPNRSSLTRLQQIDRISEAIQEWEVDWIIPKFQVPVVNLSLGQQRTIAVLREVLANPALLLIDEPTTGMNDQEASDLLTLISRLAKRRAVLVVLHHLGQTRAVADQVVLMASGRIQESTPARQFFDAPSSESGRQFLRTGSCPEEALDPDDSEAMDADAMGAEMGDPSMNATAQADDHTVNHLHTRMPTPHMQMPPLPANPRSAAAGPRGFVWLLPGRLAGTPWPGIMRDTEHDLADLKHVGVNRLVSLTEEPFDEALAAPFGIAVSHCAIVDMKAPTATQAARLCADIDSWLARGETVALHCRAGLGRTGTMLAAYWLWRGEGQRTAVDSVEQIRRLNHYMIQSTVQVDFLSDFARHLSAAMQSRPQAETPPDLGQWSDPASSHPNDLSPDRRSS